MHEDQATHISIYILKSIIFFLSVDEMENTIINSHTHKVEDPGFEPGTPQKIYSLIMLALLAELGLMDKSICCS